MQARRDPGVPAIDNESERPVTIRRKIRRRLDGLGVSGTIMTCLLT